MKTITVTVDIECDEETCGNCHGLGYVDLYKRDDFVDPVCSIYNEDLQRNKNGSAYRCERCRK